MIGEIKRYIRDDGIVKVSRSIKELEVKVKEIQKEYFYKKGEDISISQIAKELKVSKEDVALALESGKNVKSIENATFTNNKSGKCISLIETIKNETNEEELTTNKLAINELINNLEDREKKIIMLRFYKEKTQSQVAKILGITQVQVSRIERKVLQNMKMKLNIV